MLRRREIRLTIERKTDAVRQRAGPQKKHIPAVPSTLALELHLSYCCLYCVTVSYVSDLSFYLFPKSKHFQFSNILVDFVLNTTFPKLFVRACYEWCVCSKCEISFYKRTCRLNRSNSIFLIPFIISSFIQKNAMTDRIAAKDI